MLLTVFCLLRLASVPCRKTTACPNAAGGGDSRQFLEDAREYVEHVCGQPTESSTPACRLGLELKHRLENGEMARTVIEYDRFSE